MNKKQLKLKDIADIRAGYSFRSRLEYSAEGPTVIQMKDVDLRDGIRWNEVEDVLLPGREPAIWVENEDILFIARGNNNYAVHVTGVTVPTVCTPHFFHIRLKKYQSIAAEFVTWQLNQAVCQHYFDQQAEGQGLRNVRRAILEDTAIVIPELEEQNKILHLNNLIVEEERTFELLMINRKQMLAAIAAEL